MRLTATGIVMPKCSMLTHEVHRPGLQSERRLHNAANILTISEASPSSHFLSCRCGIKGPQSVALYRRGEGKAA